MNKILIVIDAQNDFISGVLGNPACEPVVEYITKKVKEYHDNEDWVFFTKDTHYKDYLNTLEGKLLPVVHCINDTWGWEISPRIGYDIEKSDMIIYKSTFGYLNWFDGLNAEIEEGTGEEINKEDIIELVGFDTDICVVSNALILRATFPNNRIIIDAKGCWGTTKENHKAALAVMKSCQIEVIE